MKEELKYDRKKMTAQIEVQTDTTRQALIRCRGNYYVNEWYNLINIINMSILILQNSYDFHGEHGLQGHLLFNIRISNAAPFFEPANEKNGKGHVRIRVSWIWDTGSIYRRSGTLYLLM